MISTRASRIVSQKHEKIPHAHQILTRWPSRPDCSPYEVLEQPRDGPYSKRRFYELVMVYHPDRWIHGTYHGISKKTRIERYRLILAANAILSDPVRRKAYDERGVGWTSGGTGCIKRQSWSGSSDNSGDRRGTKAAWDHDHGRHYGQPASGSRNCHWTQQPGYNQQKPIFMCNHKFAFMLLSITTAMSYLLWYFASSRAKLISKRQIAMHKRLLEELDRIKGRRNRTKLY